VEDIMSNLRAFARAAVGGGLLAASLLATAVSTAQPPPADVSADDLLALVSNRPQVHGSAKPDGHRFSHSAASYADVKFGGRVPRAAAKRNEREPFVEFERPAWLHLSSFAAEEESLRNVPDVGLPKFRKKGQFQSTFDDFVRRYDLTGKHVGALVAVEADVAGLPFHWGKTWQLDGKQSAALGWTSATIRKILESAPREDVPALARSASVTRPSLAEVFRDFSWTKVTATRPAALKLDDVELTADDTVSSAVVPGLMQVLAVQAPAYRIELVRQLQRQPYGEAAVISALGRLALADPDSDVRAAAVRALQREPAKKVGAELIDAFRYPWPIVAERAAEAIIELDRTDLLPALVDLLDEREPTEPIALQDGDKKVLAVREIVKLNHNRNCMVCHAPELSGGSPADLIVEVPSPEEALPPLTSPLSYASRAGFRSIRANTVHLRQDFSLLRKVADHGIWPEVQRFDYVVRTRVLTTEQAMALNLNRIPNEPPRIPSPHRRAVLYALTRLTSLYPGDTAGDWRPAIANWLDDQKKLSR
jgi:hypothetical protein